MLFAFSRPLSLSCLAKSPSSVAVGITERTFHCTCLMLAQLSRFDNHNSHSCCFLLSVSVSEKVLPCRQLTAIYCIVTIYVTQLVCCAAAPNPGSNILAIHACRLPFLLFPSHITRETCHVHKKIVFATPFARWRIVFG